MRIPSLLLACCLSACAGHEPKPLEGMQSDPPIRIERLGPRAETDEITARIEAGRLVIEIRSGMGIGRARIERPHAGWPSGIRFLLHLGALEGFEVRGARTFDGGRPGTPAGDSPIVVDLPDGIASAATEALYVQWIDRYR